LRRASASPISLRKLSLNVVRQHQQVYLRPNKSLQARVTAIDERGPRETESTVLVANAYDGEEGTPLGITSIRVKNVDILRASLNTQIQLRCRPCSKVQFCDQIWRDRQWKEQAKYPRFIEGRTITPLTIYIYVYSFIIKASRRNVITKYRYPDPLNT
jgi:hypothetical protein